jgi:hypothetical protein
VDNLIFCAALIQNGKLDLLVSIYDNKHGALNFEVIPIVALIENKLPLTWYLARFIKLRENKIFSMFLNAGYLASTLKLN